MVAIVAEFFLTGGGYFLGVLAFPLYLSWGAAPLPTRIDDPTTEDAGPQPFLAED